MNKRKMSIATKLYIFIFLTIITVATGTALLAYRSSVNQIDEYYKQVAYDSAINFSSFVDVDFLSRLRVCAESEEYQALRDRAEENDDESIIQSYLEEHGLWEEYTLSREQLVRYLRNMKALKYLYILVFGKSDAKYDMYLMDDDDNPIYETGYYETREPEFYGYDGTQKIEPTISNGDWGWLCSAFAPVYDKAGNVVCQIGCDIGMDEVMAERRKALFYIVGTAFGLTILVLFIAVYFIRKIVVNPIDDITREMKNFKPSSTDYESAGVINLNLKSNDEILELYNGIRSMQINIIDYLNDLDVLQRDKEKAEENIKDLSIEAYRDPLTGVGSKAAYIKDSVKLNQSLSGPDAEFAVVMIDLNNLKKINDQYGHKMGDLYIQGCCRLICEAFTHSPVYRIGGDEFLVILQNTNYENRFDCLRALREKYLEASRDETVNPWERYSAASGMAEHSFDDQTLDLVFRRADQAMYEDKKFWKEKNGSYR